MIAPRDARAEATARIGHRFEARVLEPSPPAVNEGPWFADDPVARGDVAAGRRVVSPVATGDLRWDDLTGGDPDLAAWCAERWLGAHRALPPAPPELAVTRTALHRLAEGVLSKTREHANGKIALRYTHHGFGTPFFGADAQVRVEGVDLVVQEGAAARRAPVTTLRAAAELVGASLLPPRPALDDDEPLDLDPEGARFLGYWFGFAYSVLEELRAQAGPELAPSRVQLWAEHFDPAVELGAEAEGRRAGFGASPGDEAHAEPYLYVVPWTAPAPGELWNASAFAGAELPYAELRAARVQRAAALDFLRARLAALTGPRDE